MAAVTAAELQSAIDTLTGHDAGSPSPVKVLKETHDSATYSRFYVEGTPQLVSAPGEIMGERAMWVRTTVSGNAAAQAAEVLAALESNTNLDPDAQA